MSYTIYGTNCTERGELLPGAYCTLSPVLGLDVAELQGRTPITPEKRLDIRPDVPVRLQRIPLGFGIELKHLLLDFSQEDEILLNLRETEKRATIQLTHDKNKITAITTALDKDSKVSWWESLFGYSPKATSFFNLLIHPVIVLLVLVNCTHPECELVLRVLEQEAECYKRMRSENETLHRPTDEGCPTEWDGVNCWNAALLGETMTVYCPESLQIFLKTNVAISRNCTASGWTAHAPPYLKACFFNTSNETDEKKGHFYTVKILYTCGYAASLLALVSAISIFLLFRKLHCPRNYIHMNLFVSFIIRGAAVFIKDAILFADENIDHCTMSTVSCKAAVVFFQYSILANFSWLLVEGMYLHTLLTLTFTSQKRYFWWYIVIGWGLPALTIAVWIKTRISFDNTGCWDDYENIYWWIIKTPILVAIFLNFIIFLNVIRILLQKIRCPDISKNYKQQYMRLAKSTLLLIPLFGIHYVIFALFPEHIGVWARLYFELVLGSNQGFIVALLYCFLNGEVQAEIHRHWGKWQTSLESNVFNLVTQDFTA
ncbi:vasoactive intestinal polypeptide receptor 1-like [Bufo gargarizans]|uniref:vasoactive intestinal polypeptide receptor 1-like n=1 Tax=Bufo gargarizans TaxID=30331 RepID=UPI001CF556BE|nr:vasoactive intestinal polypeptide receptor 1-like [Bufo gargarizans]